MPETRTEKVLVLYGSQTGNSEQAAKDLCEQMSSKLTPLIQKRTGGGSTIRVEATHMQLDDFLELERAAWTRLIVICVSSYGVGQAPLGGYRFRELCDAWAADPEAHKEQNSGRPVFCALWVGGFQVHDLLPEPHQNQRNAAAGGSEAGWAAGQGRCQWDGRSGANRSRGEVDPGHLAALGTSCRQGATFQ